MKNILYLFAACFIATLAQAQNLTEKDLQGTWGLHSVYMSGITIEMATGGVTFSEEIKAQMTPEQQEMVRGQMAGARTTLKDGTAIFEGSNITRSLAGTTKKGTYTLKDVDGKQHLAITYEDGTASEVGIFKKDNLLYISAPQNGQETELRYMKK